MTTAGPLAAALLALGALAAPAAGAPLLAREPAPGLRLVAEQSEALCQWYQEGIRAAPLVQIAARPGIDSPRLDLPDDPAALRAAVEGGPCEALRERTGTLLRADALYDPDSFALAAHRLGVARELWWVIPSRQAVAAADFDRFRAWLRAAFALPQEFLDGLRLEGREIRGEHRGLPVRMVALTDLPPLGEPALVSVDAEYFARLYENPLKEPMPMLVAGFFATLRDRRLEARAVAVSSSFADGRVPMSLAYLGNWLRELLAAPERFAGGTPETWVLQARSEHLDFMLARDQALETAEKIAGLAPEAPHPWYFRAVVSAGRGEAAEATEFAGEAARRDPAYRAGYAALAALLEGQEMRSEAATLLEAGVARFPDDPALGLALIDLRQRLGRFAEAAALARELRERRAGFPALDAALALALRAAGDAAGAAAAMEAFRARAPAGGLRRAFLAAWEAPPEPVPPPGPPALPAPPP